MSSNKNARYNRFSSGTTNITTPENTNGVSPAVSRGWARGASRVLILSFEKRRMAVEDLVLSPP